MINPQLQNRVVIITGGNHGIGAAISRAFAAQGAKVFITYKRLTGDDQHDHEQADGPGEQLYTRQRAQDASHVVESIDASGGQAVAWEADISDPATIPALFDRAEQAFGPVEVLVNNAAHWEPDTFIPAEETLFNQFSTQWMPDRVPPLSAGSHDRMFAVNSRAVAVMMLEFARRHVTRQADWGRIINISTSGAYCFPSETSYGASKLALESYTRSAAAELGQFGITANIVSPGPIQTGWITPTMEQEISRTTPLRRVGQAGDIADVVVFLASEQARWVTGQILHVGGGHKM